MNLREDSGSGQFGPVDSCWPLQNSNKKEVFYLWVRVLLFCATIFLFSSIPNYKGVETDLETWFGILRFISRKLAHLFEYALLLVFVFRATEKSWKEWFRWHFLISFIFVTIFSVSDEWHQRFVFGRDGNPFDIFIDAVGSLVGIFYCLKDEKRMAYSIY